MRFVLTINLGSETMESARDVARALTYTAEYLRYGAESLTMGDAGPIHNSNGDRVGGWHLDVGEV